VMGRSRIVLRDSSAFEGPAVHSMHVHGEVAGWRDTSRGRSKVYVWHAFEYSLSTVNVDALRSAVSVMIDHVR